MSEQQWNDYVSTARMYASNATKEGSSGNEQLAAAGAAQAYAILALAEAIRQATAALINR